MGNGTHPRQIRQKTLNPGGAGMHGDASFHSTFASYPSLNDGDGRPNGTGAVTYRNMRLTGNDDAGTGDEDNDPYSNPDIGLLVGRDTPTRVMKHNEGANGNTVEWRLHFVEFARLEINGKWYLISDQSPWRVHYKLKKTGGKWVDNGSHKAQDNAGF